MNTLIKILENKDYYYRFKDKIKEHTLSKEAIVIIKEIHNFFQTYSVDIIDWDVFKTWFLTVRHPTLKIEQSNIYVKIFDALISNAVDEDDIHPIVQSYIEKDCALKIAEHAYAISEGDDGKDIMDIEIMLKDYAKEADLDDNFWLPSADLTSMFNTVLSDGLEWGLEELNRSAGPLRKGDFVTISARPDSGKCLSKGTPILMYNGDIKPVEDVQEGELVMGPDSQPRKVSGCTSGREQMYRIQYKNGEYYDVNASHILSLKRSKAEGPHEVGDILNVNVVDYMQWPDGRKERYKGWKAGVDFPANKDYLIDPYIFGVWLGDGHSEGPLFTNQDEDVWQRIVDMAQNMSYYSGIDYRVQYQASTGAAITARITHGIQGKENIFKTNLRKMGVLGNKHIPKAYLCNSRKIRMRVLAGLIDTDGSVSRGVGYEITQKNKRLANDIVYLIRSLGYAATMREKVVNGVVYWRIHTFGDYSELPVRVHYKKLQKPENTKRKGLHFGFDVIPLGEGEYYGFAVDRDHLFMLGDFTVTHNTTFLATQGCHFLSQLPDDKQILWFNNEESSDKVRARCISAATAMTMHEIKSNPMLADSKIKSYIKDIDRFRFSNTKSISVHDVERRLADCDPGLIIFDQLWKIEGFNNAFSEYDKLTRLFGWARELAKEYSPVINVHQAGGSAEGKKWIEMGDLYGSKTGIQGEADALITIGRSLDPSDPPNDRYLYIPKNKLSGGDRTVPDERNGKYTITIDPERAQFTGVY